MHVIAFIYVKAINRKYVSFEKIFAVTDNAVKVSTRNSVANCFCRNVLGRYSYIFSRCSVSRTSINYLKLRYTTIIRPCCNSICLSFPYNSFQEMIFNKLTILCFIDTLRKNTSVNSMILPFQQYPINAIKTLLFDWNLLEQIIFYSLQCLIP